MVTTEKHCKKHIKVLLYVQRVLREIYHNNYKT